MKKTLYIIALLAAALGAVSCQEDHSYHDDTPVQINNWQLKGNYEGRWQLTSMDGVTPPEDLFLYLIIDTKEMEFELIQNMFSQYPVSVTGTYGLDYDEYDGSVFSGLYDHASGPLANDYVITDISGSSMTWTALGDPDSYLVYTACPEIPADLIPDIKSL